MPPQQHSRRRFLKRSFAAGVAASLASPSLKALASPPASSALAHSAFSLLPLGAIRPAGWLKQQLEIQASGLSGHLDETWPDVGPNSGWLGGTGESWERGPYFLDGLVPLAWLLDDQRLKSKAQKFIEWTLSSQQPSGMFGPASNDDWWPRMVMLKVLTQYAEATGDPRVEPLLRRYFRYQLAQLPGRPLKDWGRFRWQDSVLSVLWLYRRAPDPKLLELAHVLKQQGFDWQENFSNFQWTQKQTRELLQMDVKGNGLKDHALATHGVNNGQGLKTGAVWSLVADTPADRASARANVRQALTVLDRYHGLPNGMFSCDEHLAGPDPSQGSELCTVVETMFSLEQSLAILGDPVLGDRLETLAFNALPGTLTDDMWAHQYDQQPNQVECSLHRKPWTTDGPESNLFGLEPHFGCCTANFNQGWPKFAASLYMGTPEGGLALAAYSPSEVTTVLRGKQVRVTQATDYPFRGKISLTVNPESAHAFPLLLRIPGWAAGATIAVNGKQQPAPAPATFARVDRTWQPGDTVEIVFPLVPRTSRWFNNSVAISRGPLVFSLPTGTDWLKLRQRGLTADWQIFPTTAWNYGLALDPVDPAKNIAAAEAAVPAIPFGLKDTPVTLEVKARKLPLWRAEDGAANPLPQSPVASAEPEETLTLVPYAAAKLRITAFPQLEQNASA